MSDTRQNLIVGVFVMIGIVVMGGLVMAFGGGRSLFANTYDLNVEFPKGVRGVQQGQTVTLNGKRVGETRDIQFVDEDALEKGVRVVVSVEGFELPARCELIVSPNVMGIGKPPIELRVLDPAVKDKLPMDGTALIFGRMEPMLDQLIPPRMQQTFEQATRHIGDLAADLRPAAANLSRLLEQRSMSEVDAKSVTANLDTLIQRIDDTMKSFNAVIGDPKNRENFGAILANAKTMSDTGVTAMENVEAVSEKGKQLADHLDALVRRMARATDDLSAVLQSLDRTVSKLNDKTGTLGLMLNDNRLYESLLLTTKRLTKALDDLREVLDLAKRGQLRIRL